MTTVGKDIYYISCAFWSQTEQKRTDGPTSRRSQGHTNWDIRGMSWMSLAPNVKKEKKPVPLPCFLLFASYLHSFFSMVAGWQPR